MTMLAQWQRVWQALGVPNADQDLFDQLIACYSESHRHYHTLQHLQECLAHLENLKALAQRPAEVELALWFHDAIYQTGRKDNEEKSAEWAHDSALAAGLTSHSADRIFSLVLVTKHDALPDNNDAEVLGDIDLGILGAAPERFDEYERQVQEEYSWVPGPLYRRRRRKVLQGFLSRQTIYFTEPFRTLYEIQARDNIARSLGRL